MPVDIDIEIHSSAPNGKNQHVEVIFLKDVIVNVSPAAIRTVTATVSAVPPPKVGWSDWVLSDWVHFTDFLKGGCLSVLL